MLYNKLGFSRANEERRVNSIQLLGIRVNYIRASSFCQKFKLIEVLVAGNTADDLGLEVDADFASSGEESDEEPDQNAALLKFAKNDEFKKVIDALKSGANVNYRDDLGQTAGHVAAAYGALDVIRVLNEHGADWTITTTDEHQFTAVAAAKFIGELDSVKLIEALVAGDTSLEDFQATACDSLDATFQ